uniref:Uncharacterized protein n=1 Tax=Arundo donax TaxID=35708 RepID=A0A0A9G4X2_ARUDO
MAVPGIELTIYLKKIWCHILHFRNIKNILECNTLLNRRKYFKIFKMYNYAHLEFHFKN